MRYLEILILAALPLTAQPEFRGNIQPRVPLRLSQEFFAFDNGTGRDQKVPLDQQATMLKNAGYAGMAVFTGTARIPEVLKVLGDRQLRLLSIYVHSYVDDSGPRLDPGLATAIEQLAGRETMILLTVRGGGKNADQRAVEIVGEVADMAARSGLRVCLYPHVGFYVETIPDALRVAHRAGRKNVGVAFNLFHAVEFHQTRCGADDLNVTQLVRQFASDILMVSINGMSGSKILRLDQGDYDVSRPLRALNEVGYTGPIGLQGYQVEGDIQQNLERSMEAWKGLLEKITGPDPLAPRRPGNSRRLGR